MGPLLVSYRAYTDHLESQDHIVGAFICWSYSSTSRIHHMTFLGVVSHISPWGDYCYCTLE